MAIEINSKSYFLFIDISVTLDVLYNVVLHFLVNYNFYVVYVLFIKSYFLVHKQNLPTLLPNINPFVNGQMHVIMNDYGYD